MSYTVIKHPATGRFICKIDFERDIIYVVDRGQTALIDLASVRGTHGQRTENDSDGLHFDVGGHDGVKVPYRGAEGAADDGDRAIAGRSGADDSKRRRIDADGAIVERCEGVGCNRDNA